MSDTSTDRIDTRKYLVGPNDIILGRGNHVGSAGNKQFIDIVRSRSLEYWSCSDAAAKDIIAREILDTVKSLGGKFLRCNVGKAGSNNNDATKQAAESWEIVSDPTVALIKIKQTFRDLNAKQRNATSRLIKNRSTDPYLAQSKLASARLSDNAFSNHGANKSISHSSTDTPFTVDSKHTKPKSRDRSKPTTDSQNKRSERTASLKSRVVEYSNQNDIGAFQQSQSNNRLATTPPSQTFSLERNSSRLSVAAIYQPPVESLMGHVIGSQTDQMLHRNAIDQQMMAILHEQQFRSPMPIQLALANFIGANEADYTARNHNSSLLQSLIHSRLQQQQQQLQAALLQHQLNSAIFHQPRLHVQPHQPYFNDPLSVPFTQSQQHSGTIDALFSQLSPSATANVISTSLDNELVRSSFESSRMMSALAGPTNTFHSGRNITSSASMSRDLLHQLHQRSSDNEMDPIPKSDSDASNDDQKPPARGL